MRKPDAGSETGIAEERKEAILEIPHYIKNKISTISGIVEMGSDESSAREL
jgi:two-component sensor histidine kinase